MIAKGCLQRLKLAWSDHLITSDRTSFSLSYLEAPNISHQILNESDAYGWLRLRNLEFLVISQPSSHGDRILSDIIEFSPS